MRAVWLISFFIVFASAGYGQGNVFAFYEYKVKGDKLMNFINGYKRDLAWHAEQNDSWSWVGWFVATGVRRGYFIDATPNHYWTDFDNWNIDNGENLRYNLIHWMPYVKNPNGSYRQVIVEACRYKSDWYRSRILQVYYFDLHPGMESAFLKLIDQIKGQLADHFGSFVWMRTISGSPGDFLLLIPFNSYSELDKLDQSFEAWLSQLEDPAGQERFSLIVESVQNEMWFYNEQLSWYPD